MEGINLTPNYANLRAQFTREAGYALDALLRHSREVTGDLQRLTSALAIVAGALDSVEALEAFRELLADLNTRVDMHNLASDLAEVKD